MPAASAAVGSLAAGAVMPARRPGGGRGTARHASRAPRGARAARSAPPPPRRALLGAPREVLDRRIGQLALGGTEVVAPAHPPQLAAQAPQRALAGARRRRAR